MALEYIIDTNCDLRNQKGIDGLMEDFKKRAQFDMMLEMLRQQDPGKDPMTMSFVKVFRTPEGDQEKEVSMAELKEETAWLDGWRDYCAECPYAFSMRGDGKGDLFGCYGSINYPIGPNAEGLIAMTLDLVDQNLKGQLPHLVIKFILDHELDLAQIRHMRGQGQTFFVRDEPISIQVEGGTVSTDQFFDILMHYQFSSTYINKMFIPFFDAMLAVYEGASPEIKERIDMDTTFEQLLTFIHAMRIAGHADTTITRLP